MAAAMRCGSLGSSQNGCIEQLRHRRQEALAGEVELVREPALADQKAHELLGQANVPASLEGRGRVAAVSMASGWPSAPSGHSIVAVFL